MQRRQVWAGLALVVVLGGIFFLTSSRAASVRIGTQVGNLAPDFTLTDMEGKKVSLSDFRGQRVFLNFWATWCPPCRQEMPDIQKQYEQAKNKQQKLVFLTVNLQEKKDVVQRFLNQHGYTFPVLLDTKGEVAGKYAVRAIPATYLLDEKGVIRAYIPGMMDAQTMERKINELLQY